MSSIDGPTGARPTVDDTIATARDSLVAAAKQAEADVVLSIPIWGWWGDGKTTALLTILGFCDESTHGVSLRLLTDTDDLAALEEENDDYRNLNLVSVATATRKDLQGKLKQFLDECEWPLGTDAPTPYLFGLSGVVRDLGFLYMPDLPGGAYQEAEEAAKAVLARAHACVILVDARRYAGGTAEGKQYKDEVHTRLRKCHKAHIPTAVLITKADSELSGEARDETMAALSVTLELFDSPLFHLAMVSVLGNGLTTDSEGAPDLPPVSDRNPQHLMGAFLWLLSQVYGQEASRLRNTVPAVRMQRLQMGSYRAPRTVVPELRSLGQYSGLSGVMATALPTKAGRSRLLATTPAGLVELSFIKEHGVSHSMDDIGTWSIASEDTELLDIAVRLSAGRVFAGPRRGATTLWRGQLGDDLIEEHLPFDLSAWAPVALDRVVGLDSSGRLHYLVVEQGRWKQTDYVGGFSTSPETSEIWVSPKGDMILVMSTAGIDAVNLQPDGFGERTENQRHRSDLGGSNGQSL